MTSDRIRILQLQRIIILVLPHSLIPLLLGRDMRIILIHTLIQHIRLFICQRSALRLKSIQNHLRHNLLVVIIRERDSRLRKMQPVPLLELRYLLQLRYISIGYIVQSLDTLQELIAVLYNHQFIVTHQTFLPELHCRSDTQIVLYRPLVRTAENDSLILIIVTICVRNLLYQITSRYPLDISELLHLQPQIADVHNPRTILQFRYHLTDQSRIIQNTRLALLTHNSGKFRENGSAHHSHIIVKQRRAGIQTHRRQLRRVTDQNHLASCTGTHKRYEVLKQIARTERRSRLLLAGIDTYQRHLIHDKESILVLVRSQTELTEAVASYRLLPIDMLMDCVSRLIRIRRQDLCRPSRWSKQHTFGLILLQDRYHSRNRSRLAGTRISIHNQNVVVIRTDEIRHLAQQTVLALGRFKLQTGNKRRIKKVTSAHPYLLLLNNIEITMSTGKISTRPRNISNAYTNLATAG